MDTKNWNIVRATIGTLNGPFGAALHVGNFTDARLIAADSYRDYKCYFVGPLFDPHNYDIRIFATYRELEGMTTVEPIIQDATDDVFLNHDAEGVEQYNIGIIRLKPTPEEMQRG